MSVFRPIRWLILASLVISLPLSGLAPGLITFADTEFSSSAKTSQTCCCGTEEGRCCGMGCCVSQSPTAPEKPIPIPARDDYRPLFAEEPIDANAFTRGLSFLKNHLTSEARFSPAEISLQTLHVRLDV